MPKGRPNNPKSYTCPVCGNYFIETTGNQIYCSKICKRKQNRLDGCESTERQYELISGDWEKYFNRLRNFPGRREHISTEDCITLLEKQKYLCALSGVELTCVLKKGSPCKTNASIDKINPNGLYTIDNIQLVCAALNKFRVDTPIDEFVEWCRKVVNYHAIRE